MLPIQYEAELLYRPSSAELRFLPEGPYDLGGGRFSWVGIQHGGTARTGSLNFFDLSTGRNTSLDLPGRPGFAFPTTDPDQFVVGLERHVRLVNVATGELKDVCGPVDEGVEGTIINDATLVPGGLVFGCKDVKFKENKAGLYLWRNSDRALITLRQDQTCSNGKKPLVWHGRLSLFDIDTPTKRVVVYPLDVAAGTLEAAEVVLDLRDDPAYPDGMVLSPDGASAIIAFYDPRNVEAGVARQYDLATGQVQCEWRTPKSPRVTCPALVAHEGRVRLVLTTAVEHMTESEQSEHSNAGCLFTADTPFDTLSAAPVFQP